MEYEFKLPSGQIMCFHLGNNPPKELMRALKQVEADTLEKYNEMVAQGFPDWVAGNYVLKNLAAVWDEWIEDMTNEGKVIKSPNFRPAQITYERAKL